MGGGGQDNFPFTPLPPVSNGPDTTTSQVKLGLAGRGIMMTRTPDDVFCLLKWLPLCKSKTLQSRRERNLYLRFKEFRRDSECFPKFWVFSETLSVLKGCAKKRLNFSDYLKLISCTVLIFRFQFLLIESARKKSEANWSKTISFRLIEKMKKLSFLWLFCMHPTAIVQWWQSDF